MWPFQGLLALCLLKVLGYYILLLKRMSKQDKKHPVAGFNDLPTVDIVLPMYNEEKVVVDTIPNLLEIKYEKFSIIVVDDGSTDASFDLVKSHFGGHPLVQLVHQQNEGKSSALNKAMSVARSEIVVTIDADTWVKNDAVEKIVAYFEDEKVAAVAGHIKVGNRVNLLTDMQYYEYISIWDNDRAFSDTINGILIVPGALAAYRRSAVNAVGGFKSEVIAEDTELTLRLLYNNYVMRNASEAVACTEAPDTLKMFFRQRIRWTTGLTQGLVKHNKKLFGHSNRFLAYLILPFTWLFRIILPFFIPIVDYYFIYAYFFLNHREALAWWLAVIFTEGTISFYLLVKFNEKINIFKLLVAQRLYRHLLFCIYWLIFSRGTNGTLFKWKKITRKGNVSLKNATVSPQPKLK